MENFFGLLKSDFLYLQTFESVEQFKKELVEYLEWYNEKRIKVKLKGLTPFTIQESVLKISLVKESNYWGTLHTSRDEQPFFLFKLLIRNLVVKQFTCMPQFFQIIESSRSFRHQVNHDWSDINKIPVISIRRFSIC